MRFFAEASVMEESFHSFIGVVYIILFFVSVYIMALLAHQKRFKRHLLIMPVTLTAYIVPQLMIAIYHPCCEKWMLEAILSVPDFVPVMLFAVLAVVEIHMLKEAIVYGRKTVTAMSIKEATDSLSAGIMYSSEDGRILLSNFAMESFCMEVTGKPLRNGKIFLEDLREGRLLEGCRIISDLDQSVIVLSAGRAVSCVEHEVEFEGHTVKLLIAADISEVYDKTEKLRCRRKELTMLGNRLASLNEEIVALTTEKEMLSAKLRIHDELGSNLLAIKNYCVNGGTEEDYAGIADRLKRNVTFLKSEPERRAQDEYELIIKTAAELGVKIFISGELPQSEPAKHIIAVAMHECFTNTLRHANGDTLFIELFEDKNSVNAVFTNNGEQPKDEIQEKGGLLLLREMTESAAGSMRVSSMPEFSVSIKLTK